MVGKKHYHAKYLKYLTFFQAKKGRIFTKSVRGLTYSVLEISLHRRHDLPYICPGCGRQLYSAKSKNESKRIHSLPVHGHLLELIYPRHRINCKPCNYPYEPLPGDIHENHRVTTIYSQWIYEKCKVMTYKDLAAEIGLSDNTIRKIEKLTLTDLIKNRTLAPFSTIGIDEIQSGHGHQYSHIITDMDNEEVIWVGDGRKSVDLAPFLWAFRGKLKDINWVVMDMWKGFIKVFSRFCPNAKAIHDHFHISKHLNEAINELRIKEYKKALLEDRSFIKGTKWLLLSRKSTLTERQTNVLKSLFNANKKLLKAYLLKEEFRKLWSYNSKAWAFKFWQNWKSQLRWQRLEPFKKFVKLVDNHIDGIMAFYENRSRVKMGYIEGMNNKVKTLIRRHYGFRDKKYLKLKIIQTGSKSLKQYIPYPWVEVALKSASTE